MRHRRTQLRDHRIRQYRRLWEDIERTAMVVERQIAKGVDLRQSPEQEVYDQLRKNWNYDAAALFFDLHRDTIDRSGRP